MTQCQRGGREDVDWRAWSWRAGQKVEEEVGRVEALRDRFGASCLDCWQPVGEHRGENVDHLPITVIDAGELVPHPFHRGRQNPILERRAVAQGAWLAGKHWYVVPGVVGRVATAER